MNTDNRIPCSVGILTYNSAKTLRRTLESVKDFSDIIISDGGSTDETVEIASEYGCRVIDQDAKHNPGPHPDYPIEDFASERNKLLAVAKEDWFLWLDSDEYISRQLHDEIIEVCTQNHQKYLVYELGIVRQNTDGTISYKDWNQTYQTRFFNRKMGCVFERKIHERIVFNRDLYPVGRLKGAWYVPISKIEFSVYKEAVNYRLELMLSENVPTTFPVYLKKAFWLPLKRAIGTCYRYVRLRLFFSADEIPPTQYFLNRLYSQWVTFCVVTRLYFGHRDRTP